MAPSGPVPADAFAAGLAVLGARYDVRVGWGASVLARTGFLAGSDNQRLAALTAAFEEPDVGAIVMARQGDTACSGCCL